MAAGLMSSLVARSLKECCCASASASAALLFASFHFLRVSSDGACWSLSLASQRAVTMASRSGSIAQGFGSTRALCGILWSFDRALIVMFYRHSGMLCIITLHPGSSFLSCSATAFLTESDYLPISFVTFGLTFFSTSTIFCIIQQLTTVSPLQAWQICFGFISMLLECVLLVLVASFDTGDNLSFHSTFLFQFCFTDHTNLWGLVWF